MASNPDQILPSAKEFMKRLALAEAAEADKIAKAEARANAEKKALIDHLRRPWNVSADEVVKRAVVIIERAVSNGKAEVQIYRFRNALCTDRGRAIIQQEVGWEKTLTDVPKEIYKLWSAHFRDKGYKLRVEIIDFPGGLPGDIGMTLSWA